VIEVFVLELTILWWKFILL